MDLLGKIRLKNENVEVDSLFKQISFLNDFFVFFFALEKYNTQINFYQTEEIIDLFTSRSLAFVLIFNMDLGVLVQLLTGYGMMAFFRNTSAMKFLVRYLGLFGHFSSIDSSEWF